MLFTDYDLLQVDVYDLLAKNFACIHLVFLFISDVMTSKSVLFFSVDVTFHVSVMCILEYVVMLGVNGDFAALRCS